MEKFVLKLIKESKVIKKYEKILIMKIIIVLFIGRKIENKTIFKTVYTRDDPYSYYIGENRDIKLFDSGVFTMKKNEKALFVVESNYAYGKKGFKDIVSPNETVEFLIELIDFFDQEKTKWDYSSEERVKLSNQFKNEGDFELLISILE